MVYQMDDEFFRDLLLVLMYASKISALKDVLNECGLEKECIEARIRELEQKIDEIRLKYKKMKEEVVKNVLV